MNVEIIGSIAATMTGISFLPQVVKVVKTKSTQDISLAMFSIFTVGIILWFVYSILIKSLPMIILDICELPLCLIIIGYKMKFG